MHELGIVFYIIDGVKEVAQTNHADHVESVTVGIGEVSGIVPDLLQDAWKWAAEKEPVLQGAHLLLDREKASSQCRECGETFSPLDSGRQCPVCHSYHTVLISGSDATIKSITVRER